MGSTVSFRGLDNASYYRLQEGNPRLASMTPVAGTLWIFPIPMVLRLVMDSLRHWATEWAPMGFRFDLATTLGREEHGFSAAADFFVALRQDPVLSGLKLIAEPWDVGPGGYQLGGFPAPMAEWNDVYRDGVRRFWRGGPQMASDLAARLLGSAERFDHCGRRPWSTVNFVTAMTGSRSMTWFRTRPSATMPIARAIGTGTMRTTVPTAVPRARPRIRLLFPGGAQRMRNLMATLLVSQGTPMLLAGDEFGNSQSGNNNAYCQDNPLGWVDWSGKGKGFHAFVAADRTQDRSSCAAPGLVPAWRYQGERRRKGMLSGSTKAAISRIGMIPGCAGWG